MEPTLYYLFLFFSFPCLFFIGIFMLRKKLSDLLTLHTLPQKKKKIGSSHDVTHAYKLVFSKDEFKEISPK
jgi:hypothetical protein